MASANPGQRFSLHESLGDVVARGLRQAIMDGQIKPGERIRQEEVAREYGTSRIPVREALQRLQAEGLVTLITHVGARVAKLDLGELDEVYQIRERLEPLAISHSVSRLTADDCLVLTEYAREMEATAADDDPGRWIDLDRSFHLLALSRAPLPRVLAMIEGLWNASQQYRRMYVLIPERTGIAHLEHHLILEAIRRSDPDDAERLCAMHIRRTRLTLDKRPDLFQGPARMSPHTRTTKSTRSSQPG